MAAGSSIDLKQLTIGELEQLARLVAEEIGRKRAAGREWLAQHGNRIVEAERSMYQNPSNAAQTWSGKGKQPQWVEEALAKGGTLESLLTDSPLPANKRPGSGREGGR